MNEPTSLVVPEHLPFYITAPGESDILLAAVAFSLVAIVVGFGALYFTIQAIPDRIAKGSSRTQMQIVGLLGLISLISMNNIYWVIAILLAAIRIPDFSTPLREIAGALKSQAVEPDPQPEPDAEPDPEPDPMPGMEAAPEPGPQAGTASSNMTGDEQAKEDDDD